MRLLWMARSPARFTRLMRMKGSTPEPLVVPALSPGRIYIRPRASDRSVLSGTLWAGFDNAPSFIPRDRPTRIWDLGANVGLTTALYAMELPLARITGVELDGGNAELARRNTAAFGDRCEILTGAVWTEDGSVAYSIRPGGEQQAKVNPGGSGRRVAAYALNTLFGNDAWVDLVKMDIEGAEIRVLRENTEWAEKVGCIKLECHRPYAVEAAIADLEKLGFAATASTRHRHAVMGIRDRGRGAGR